jgi:hypothetical protein
LAPAESEKPPWTNPKLVTPSFRAEACAALWALVRHWSSLGMPRSEEATLDSFEDYAEVVGSVVIHAGLANPFGRRENTRGGNDAGRALIAAICALAKECHPKQELTTQQILNQLEEDGTLDIVVPKAKNELGQKLSLGWKLQHLRGNVYTDPIGRRFEFGHRDDQPGAKYTLHFLDREAAVESE